MNIQPVIQRTRAEEALNEAIVARAGDLPGNPDIRARREEAAARIERGLPTRRVEAWHYTDMRRLLSSVPAFSGNADAKQGEALIPGSTILPVLDGTASTSAVIEGVSVTSLAEAMNAGTSLDDFTFVAEDDVVGALNVALASDGYVIDIPAGTVIDKPVELHNVHSVGQMHSRFIVRAGAGSKAVFIERQTGTGTALVSAVSKLQLEKGAEILWIVVQDQPEDATHLGQFNADIAEDAKLTLFVINSGAQLIRQEVRIAMNGSDSDFQLRGVNLVSGTTHCDVTMVLDHIAPDTDSTEIIRNVVADRGQGVFQGMIRVAQEAQKTDARMACNTLLLSDEAGFATKPELEIFADDVACGHGATVTDINSNHLYYLMARGIDEKTARGLLVRAFVAEIIEEIESEEIVEILEDRLTAWFADHL